MSEGVTPAGSAVILTAPVSGQDDRAPSDPRARLLWQRWARGRCWTRGV